MKPFDRLLQRWRIAKVRPYLKTGARVLDIGCADGALFRIVPGLGESVGIDPTLTAPATVGAARLQKGNFPADLPDAAPFDAITMLAVLEHIPRHEQAALAQHCRDALAPGSLLLITAPARMVDHVLTVLQFLRLIDGMSLEEHYGFEPGETMAIFGHAGFRLVKAERFQLGLNHLFVFERA